jgi:Flp pilus assembly protein TadG
MMRRAAHRRGAPTGGGGERTAGERGSVAAELAVALPAVVVVVAIGIGALVAASTQVRLQDVAADGARLVARGEPEARASGLVAQVRGARAVVAWSGDLVCVTAAADARLAGVRVPLSAVSCALAGGL